MRKQTKAECQLRNKARENKTDKNDLKERTTERQS